MIKNKKSILFIINLGLYSINSDMSYGMRINIAKNGTNPMNYDLYIEERNAVVFSGRTLSTEELEERKKRKREEKQERQKQYRERLEKEAEQLGVYSNSGSTADLKGRIKEKRQEQYRERLEKKAEQLGIYSYNSGSTAHLKGRIEEKRQEQYRQRLMKEAKQLGVSSNIGSTAHLKGCIEEKKREQREKIMHSSVGRNAPSSSFLSGARDFHSGSNNGERELTRYGRPSYKDRLDYNNGYACARGPSDSDWTK